MIQRIRNVIKTANKKARATSETPSGGAEVPRTKKGKKDNKLLTRYPLQSQASTSDDPQSVQGHLKALEAELKKNKPRESIIHPLMKSTFQFRREWILDRAEPIHSIIEKYPALSYTTVVS